MFRSGALVLLLLFVIVFKEGKSQRSTSRVRLECTPQELQKCMRFLQPVTEGNDSALPGTKAELMAVCDDLRAGVKCLDRHSRTCFSQEQTMVYKDLVTPAKEFISQLCDDGRIQTDFLRHAHCYRNISLDVEKCALKYQDAVKTSSSSASSGKASSTSAQDADQVMRMSCCALREFVNCKYKHVGRDCGREAENFMRNHMGQMTNPIMERHCAAYTHSCDEITTDVTPASPSVPARVTDRNSGGIQLSLSRLLAMSMIYFNVLFNVW